MRDINISDTTRHLSGHITLKQVIIYGTRESPLFLLDLQL